MEVNGYCQLFGYQHSSKKLFFFWYSSEEINSYRFGTTWGWRIFFLWTIFLKRQKKSLFHSKNHRDDFWPKIKSMIWSSHSQSDQISLLSTWVFTHKTLYTPGAMRRVTALTARSGLLLKEIRLELCCWCSVQICYRGGTDHWTGLRMKAHDFRGIQDERHFCCCGSGDEKRSSGLIWQNEQCCWVYMFRSCEGRAGLCI